MRHDPVMSLVIFWNNLMRKNNDKLTEMIARVRIKYGACIQLSPRAKPAALREPLYIGPHMMTSRLIGRGAETALSLGGLGSAQGR
jgi:hypothetical protein